MAEIDTAKIYAQLRDVLGNPCEDDYPPEMFDLKISNEIRRILGQYKQLRDGQGGIVLTGDDAESFYEAVGKFAAWQYLSSPEGRLTLSGLLEVKTGPVETRTNAGDADSFLAALKQSATAALRLIGLVGGGFSTESRLARSGPYVPLGDREPRSVVESAYGPRGDLDDDYCDGRYEGR